MYILTFDYELFGSGGGDVIDDLVKPTEKILEVLDLLCVKAVFFVEQLEIDALIGLKNVFPEKSKEYSDAVALENQLNLIARNGHDIQLHLHPQWYGATYKEGKWNLNFDWWCFSSLPYRTSLSNTPGKYDLIHMGKKSLEERVRKIQPDYVCHSFRAGGYNIGIEKTSVDALAQNGIKLDSSICPGYFSSSSLSNYDYTSVNCREIYWNSKESLYDCAESYGGDKGCLELPLITVKSHILEKISLSRIYSNIKNRKKKAIKNTSIKKQYTPKYPSKIKNTNYDVCLSSKAQIKRLNHEIKTRYSQGSECVVLIGHPKDYSIFSPMKTVIKSLKIKGDFITLDQFLRENIK